MPERVILDPSELASNRTELDITPWLGPDGVDWGDSSIEAFYSQSARGAIPVDYQVPNREVGGGLVLKSVDGTTATAARAAIQAKVALLQREGGWLKRVTNSGGTVFADVVNASFRATSVPGYQSRDDIDTAASFTLECIPDFYEAEVTDADNSTTTQRELLVTTTDVDGDNPNRVRMVVDNDGSTDWRGLIWCFRSRHYPGSTAATRDTGTASMVYEAESLGTLDTATKTAGTAIYGTATNGQFSGGTIVHHGTLSTSWTPVLSGRIGGTTYPTHTGSYDIWAILASTSGTAVQARAVWDVGDLVNPVENTAYRMPGANNRYFARLGEVRIDDPGLGTHRWDWQIQGKGEAGGENLSVDKVYLVNKDEGMGVLSCPIPSVQGLSTFSARSEFTTESGAITGDALAVGGNWTVVTNSDTDDFTVSDGAAARSAVSDSGSGFGLMEGRAVSAGSTNYADIAVRVDFKATAIGSTSPQQALFCRLVDSSNYMVLYADPNSTKSNTWAIGVVVAGTYVQSKSVATPARLPDVWYSLLVTVNASGRWAAWYGLKGSALTLLGTGQHSALATGGALATGRVGIVDRQSATLPASTRSYDGFAAWVPANDAVAFDGQSAQLTTNGILREDAGGTAYGPVSVQGGDLPRLPVPPQSGGTVETLLIPTTGDLDALPDTMGTASISARANRRASWLFVDNT